MLGPVPLPAGSRQARPTDAAGAVDEIELHRAVLRVPRASGAALSRALVELSGVRSARKLPALRVQVDPVGLE